MPSVAPSPCPLSKEPITSSAPRRSPLKVNPKEALTGGIGGLLTVGVLYLLSGETGVTWIMAPFGASCVLAFGVWDSPLSQPRNIIGGHCIATGIGLVVLSLFGATAWSAAAAVGAAITVMMLTKTTHPPAGADPLVVIMSGASWKFLFTLVLVGSIIIVLLALFVNNVRKGRAYPTFWI